MSKASDYRGDRDFEAFLSLWVEQRQVVPEFGDWLRDRGLDAAADAVAWAAAQPERVEYHSRYYSCPFPDTIVGRMSWFADYLRPKPEECDDLPPPQLAWVKDECGQWVFWPTAADAICALLDNWIPEAVSASV